VIVVLDTHALHWWAAEPDRLSQKAAQAVRAADELAVAAITWFELAWLARRERITVSIAVRSWLDQLSRHVRTLGITPAIAETAASLPLSFPGDPADRLIYATAIEHGCQLITKDGRLLSHAYPRPVAIW
jgi:PIN domain nuclease of toxin-antitoxin system